MRYNCLIIDGNNLAHRCFHTHKDLGAKVNGKFMFTGLAYGFINSIVTAIKTYLVKEDFEIFCAWDRGRDRRIAIYPEYKGNRPHEWSEYDNFSRQKLLCQKLLPYIGIKQAFKQGEEADDVVGTLSKYKAKAGQNVLILSGDHDFIQLIDRNITLCRPSSKDPIYDIKRVNRDYGINPFEFVYVMSLAGDSGDNIPGIKGVAEKTALKIHKENPTLVEAILNDKYKSELKTFVGTPKIKSLIESNINTIKLTYQLVKIVTDLSEISYSTPIRDFRALKMYFEMLKFHSLLEGEKWNTLLRIS